MEAIDCLSDTVVVVVEHLNNTAMNADRPVAVAV